MEGPGMQQWNEGPRHKMAVTSKEGHDMRHDLQKDLKAWDQKSNSRVFDWAMRSEWVAVVDGSAPSKTKEEKSKAQSSEKNKDNGGSPGLYHTLSGNHSGWAALREEQQEQLESHHCDNRATGKEQPVNRNLGTVFSVRSVLRCYKQDKLGVSQLVGEFARRLLLFSQCELLLWEDGRWAQEVWEPRGMGMSVTDTATKQWQWDVTVDTTVCV
jgi:hypothetical protein